MPTFTANWFPASIFETHAGELKRLPRANFLEIGAFEGRGALHFFEKFLGDTGTLTCIDPFVDYSKSTAAEIKGFDHLINPSIRQRFLDNTHAFRDRISLHEGLSRDVLPTLPSATFDLAFIDGDHSREAVRIDARECWRLVKIGGYIVFDDYSWNYPAAPAMSPKEAIDEFLFTRAKNLKVLHRDWCVVVKKLRD